jgi:triacylglycerol esterase/lipase EstA (alpha/beta hydrolase family)
LARFAMIVFLQFFLATHALAQATLTQESSSSCEAPCVDTTAIIFVHGLTGSSDTWKNATTTAYFPKLLAEDPAVKDRIEVYSIEYGSLWTSGQPIVAVTKSVSAQIDTLLADKKFGQVVFIAHSLGGNIAREYMVHVKARFGHAALSRFRLMITLGTPFDGASHAGFLSLFSSNQQLRSLVELQKNDFLQLMRETEADAFNKRINNNCATFELDAVFETERVGPLIIVSRASATANATRTAGDDFAKDHISLPKPADRDDKVYAWVRDEVGLCVAGEARCQASPNPNPICAVGDF